VHLSVRAVQSFIWSWQGRRIEAVYEVVGSGPPVLLLPAFSTVSSREEMRPLASCLAEVGFACTLMDWPGFGSSTRGRLGYGPALYKRFLVEFCAASMPAGGAVIAAGHASGYALALGQQRPGLWRRVVLLAPTWRGPLPTAMGPRPRAYAAARALVRAPVIGEAVYRLNTHPRVIGMMYRRHVYADADQLTPDFIATKRGFACRPGARFASVAFVTGALDPVPDRQSFQALLRSPSAPTLILCGTATPPKSKAEMAAIVPNPGVTVQWVPGSLGLYEEAAEVIAAPVAAFLAEHPRAERPEGRPDCGL
jgi:pimeloyl-ACP methyl ester carboxylesterase